MFYIFLCFFKSIILNWNFHYVSDFELKKNKNTTRQILNWKKHNASDFELKKIQRVRFWIEKKYNASDFKEENFT